jgi:hypothetical protein
MNPKRYHHDDGDREQEQNSKANKHAAQPCNGSALAIRLAV